METVLSWRWVMSRTILSSPGASGIVVNNAAGLLKLNGTGTVQAARVTAASNTGKGVWQVNAICSHQQFNSIGRH